MIPIKFTDWWNGYDPKADPFFHDFLFNNYDLKFSENPEVIFSFVPYFGRNEADKYPNAKKVYYSGEYITNEVIHSILDKGHYLIYSAAIDHPNYLQMGEMEKYRFYGQELKYEIPEKKRFCSFIYQSNRFENICKREEFCKKLSEYKRVDCMGRSLHNHDEPRLAGRYNGPSNSGLGKSNIDVIKDYKFNIGYENRSYPGYLTEKIWWGFLANTISIYWGDTNVYDTFHRGSFICRHDYDSNKDMIEYIKYLDQNEDAYNEVLVSPKIKDKYRFSDERIIKFFNKIL